jgi:hypothetical protein
MNLPTAMATCAGAVNPQVGVGGKGLTINSLVSFIMTLLNVRLGYWATNPNHIASKKGLNPNFFFPGLQDLFGVGYHEKSIFIEIGDGAGFENLAFYEMIRRNVKIAIVSDGGGDPCTFIDLSNAIEKVRVDFGATILFDNPDYDLRGMITGSGNAGAFETLYGTAQRGFAIGTIYYSNGTQGKLFYIKPTITEDLPADIYGYKAAHDDFPNESTIDQFFNERQFEAYRELGYRVSTSLFANLDENWEMKQS